MRILLSVLALVCLVPGLAAAQEELEPFELPEVDLMKAFTEDATRQLVDESAHFAVALPVDISPLDLEDGDWDLDGSDYVWRLRLRSPGALSLSLAFTSYRMPEGGRLTISSTDGTERIGPFTPRDNEDHGELWTAPLLADDVALELRLPVETIDQILNGDTYDLRLTQVHHGYAGFGEQAPLSGLCQRDVACFDDPMWHDAARSVAMISIEGVRFCSGFMVNNTALDGRPLFMTAEHCGVRRDNAASVVVMWSFESSFCRDQEEAALEAPFPPSRRFQTGARLLASYSATDVAILELDDLPNMKWNVHYAGWDRSKDEPTGVTVIHHPNTDQKRMSVDYDRTKASSFRYEAGNVKGSHLRIGAWEIGSTEGGSSGSPLFNQDQRVVGQLHGGYAECGEKEADWFGRLAVSWHGGGQSDKRLSDWLDPLETDTLALDGLDASKLLDP